MKIISVFCILVFVFLTTMASPPVLLADEVVVGGEPASSNSSTNADIPRIVVISGLADPLAFVYSSYDSANDLLVFSASDAFKVITNATGGSITVTTGGTLAEGFSAFSATLTVTTLSRGTTNTVVNASIKASPALVNPGAAVATGGTFTVRAIGASW
jgi:hypothetical protein